MATYLQRPSLPSRASLFSPKLARPVPSRKFSVETLAAQEPFCRDKVATVPKAVRAEGTSTVSFLGAGGQEISIECPKVLLKRKLYTLINFMTSALQTCETKFCFYTGHIHLGSGAQQ
jgi:hypothetical protein